MLTKKLLGVLDGCGKKDDGTSPSSALGDQKIVTNIPVEAPLAHSSDGVVVGVKNGVKDDGKKMNGDDKEEEMAGVKRKGIDDTMNFDNSKFEEIANPNLASSNLPNSGLIEKIKRGLEEESSKFVMEMDKVKDELVGENKVVNEEAAKKDGPTIGNVWNSGVKSVAEILKKQNELDDVVVKYIPPLIQPDGSILIDIPEDVVKRGSSAYALHLYRFFVGINLPFREVTFNLRRMWRKFDVGDMSLDSETGIWLFKFKSEEGMKKELENGTWLVNGVPLFIREWSPGVLRTKPEPNKVPLWISLHGVPFELWNGDGISYLGSGVGKPIMLDQVTKDRCLKSSGRVSYARVLVEVCADRELPVGVKAKWGSFPITTIPVSYQWKPPQCDHCKVFGHDFKTCTIRHKSEQELAELKAKEVLEMEAKKKKEKEKFEGSWNVVRRRGMQNRGMGNQGRQNEGFQSGSGGGKRDGVNQSGGKQGGVSVNKVGAAGPSGTKHVVDQALKIQKSVDKGKNVLGSELVVKKEYRPVVGNSIKSDVVKPLNAKKNNYGGNTSEVKISNNFEVLKNNTGDVIKESWDNQKMTADMWFELKKEPPKYILSKWSNELLDYFYSKCDFSCLKGDDVLSNEDAPDFMKLDNSVLGTLRSWNDPVIQRVSP